MTTTNIPPCSVCGEIPNAVHGAGATYNLCNPKCECLYSSGSIPKWNWIALANNALINALRELGIETVEQLKAKMQPDPRVAVLERVAKCAETYMDATAHCSGNQFYDDAALGLANAIIDMYNTQNQPA